MPVLVDSHAHLYFQDFYPDWSRCLIVRGKSASNGLLRLVSGDNIHSAHAAFKLAQDHPFIYLTAGLHPQDARFWTPETG